MGRRQREIREMEAKAKREAVRRKEKEDSIIQIDAAGIAEERRLRLLKERTESSILFEREKKKEGKKKKKERRKRKKEKKEGKKKERKERESEKPSKKKEKEREKKKERREKKKERREMKKEKEVLIFFVKLVRQ